MTQDQSEYRSTPPTVADLVAFLDELYPPRLAQSWDSNGLILGDPRAPVRSVLVAVDPVAAVAEQASLLGVDFVLTHHPLYLRGTDSVAATTGKGSLTHALIREGIALMNCHTNADAQRGGVADALADLVSLPARRRPLVADAEDPGVGIGRIGDLDAPVRLAEFAARCARVLPASPPGLLVSGDPDRMVRRVAVSGGAGDSLLARANELGADCFLTADLRHHPASEHAEDGGAALLCGTHWATEWPWVPVVATALRQRFEGVRVHCSDIVTEAWTMRLATGVPGEHAKGEAIE